MTAFACAAYILGAQSAQANRSCDPAEIDSVITNSPLCAGDHINLSVIASGDIIGYSWEGPGTGTSFSFTPEYSFSFQILGDYTIIVYGDCGNDTAVVTITAQGAGAGQDNTLDICDNGPPKDLEDALGVHATGGTWAYDELPHSGIYTPGVDEPGEYVYTSPFPATCPGTSQTATITVVEVTVGPNAQRNICESDSAFDLMEALATDVTPGGEWSYLVFLSLEPHSGIYDPSIDSSGTFRYSVQGCVASVIMVEDPLLAWFEDLDGDGFGDPLVMEWSCYPIPGYVADSTDNCIGVMGKTGEPCDDGLPETIDDVITDSCTCEGVLPTAILSTPEQPARFMIWPNPNNGDQLFLRIADTGPAEVRIFDATGRQYLSEKVLLHGDEAPLRIPLGPTLAQGLYLIQVTAAGGSGTIPLVIR